MRSHKIQKYQTKSASLSEPHPCQTQTCETHPQTLKNKKYRVFVAGLSNEMTHQGLINYFKSIYPSTISFISKGFGSQKKKICGFGFLLLGSKEDLNAILLQKTFFYKSRHLRAEPYLKDRGLEEHKEDLDSKRVFIGRVPQNMNSTSLWRILEEDVGAVENAYVVNNTKREKKKHKKKHKGFGYAVFASSEIALKAQSMKGLYVQEFESFLNFEKVRGKKTQKNKKNFERSDSKNDSRKKNQRAQVQREEPKNRNQGDEGRFLRDVQIQHHHNLSNFRIGKPEECLHLPHVDLNNFQEAEQGQLFWNSSRAVPPRGVKGSSEPFLHPRNENSNKNTHNNKNNKRNRYHCRRFNLQTKNHYKTNKKSSPIDLKLIMAKNGWKEHSLRLLNHSDTNVRLNQASNYQH